MNARIGQIVREETVAIRGGEKIVVRMVRISLPIHGNDWEVWIAGELQATVNWGWIREGGAQWIAAGFIGRGKTLREVAKFYAVRYARKQREERGR